VDVDGAAVLTHLHHEGVDPDERVVRRVEGPVAECFDLRVQMRGHLQHLRLRQRGDTELLDEFLHPPGRHPEQIRRRHHTDEGLFGPPVVGQQPVGEIRALPQFRDRQFHRARPGVPLPCPVTVALIGPFVAAFAVRRTAQSVGLRGHERFGKGFHHRTQQIG
jgi:hypothetical protein